jgi:hypothetical protein
VESNLTFDGSILTITGAVDASTYVTTTVFRETYFNLGSGTNVTIDLSTANNFRRQFTSSAAVTFSNPPAGKAFGFTLLVVNGGSGTITWPGTVRWAGGTGAPALTLSGTDILVFYTYDGGTTYYGFVTGLNMA